jgi:hypothetical protein
MSEQRDQQYQLVPGQFYINPAGELIINEQDVAQAIKTRTAAATASSQGAQAAARISVSITVSIR